MTEREPWHLSKQVPIALIVTIAVQTVGVVWWAATLSAQVSKHDQEIRALTVNDQQMQGETRRVAEALVRVDERLAAQTELLRRVEAAINRQNGSR